MIKSNELFLSVKAAIDSDFGFIKENFYKITQIYLENGRKFLDIVNKIGYYKFNEWLKLEFPQELLTIRKQVLVARFLADNPNYEGLIKNFDLEFLCILAKAPDTVAKKVLEGDGSNWSIAQLKGLIKDERSKLKAEMELNNSDKMTDDQKLSDKELEEFNQVLKAENQEYQELIVELRVANEKLRRDNQLLCENNRLLQGLLNDISTATPQVSNPNVTKFDYVNRTLFIERNMF